MATFKVVVQKQRNDGFYAVYIRVTHNRGVKYLRTDKIVDAKGINKKNKENGSKSTKLEEAIEHQILDLKNRNDL